MPTKPKTRNTKKTFKVRVGGKKTKTIWYKRRLTYVFVLTFAISGSILLVLTRAASSINCISTQSNGSTISYCISTAPTYNALLATADYVAADQQSLMTSATLSLEICSPQTHICTPTDTSSAIRLYSSSQPRYQRLYTHGVTLLRGAIYRTCLSMNTNAGWRLNHSCTNMLIYGNSVSNSPQVSSSPTQPSAASATTNTLSEAPTTSKCNEGNIAKPGGGTYQCSFDEEFNGASLDATKWVSITAVNAGFGSGRDCYVNTPNNISVAGGTLNLITRKEAAPFTCYQTGKPARSAQVTSGNVSTVRNFSQQYGRFEIRAKVPNVTKPGLQESFWLWPNKPFDQDPGNAPWPATGEIDIVEMYHANPDRAIPFLHYIPESPDSNVTNNYCYIDVSQYHTYVLTWTADSIKIDVDGYNCVTDSFLKPKAPQAKPQPFNKPFYISLTSGLGVYGSANDYVEGTTPLPATTQVDYVRVWQ